MNIKQELVRHYLWLRQYGLNDSHSGNASVREGDTVWVTPTGCCADTLTADELVACTVGGEIGTGASLDAALHVAVYRSNPDCRAVLHSHGPYSVAMTMDGKDYVPADFEGQYYFPHVPVLNIEYQDYLQDSPAQVAHALQRNRLAIVRGHGVYARAESVNLAYKWSCSLELSVKTALLALQAGTIS